MADKKIKLEIGTIYKKTPNGSYYFRYQIKGQRQAVSLKTKNIKEAEAKAQELIPVIKGTTTEIISAHVKRARSLVKRIKTLTLGAAWETYAKHSERAMPATVAEESSYQSTFEEFVRSAANDLMEIREVSPEITNKYAQYIRSKEIAVGTHNRKIRHLKKIFDVLQDYRDAENPFDIKSLRRKEREEQESSIRRLSFSREEEASLLEVLDDKKYKVMNKPEIRIIYHLGMFTGQRFKDCIMLRWDQIDLNRKRIWVKQFKTGKEVTIPMAPKLLEVLLEAKEWKKDHYICPNVAARYNQLDKNGKNVGNNLVNIDALRVIKWIGLTPSVKVPGRKKKITVYGFHSLRHSFVSHCAEAGVPKAVVLSIIGTNSDIVDKHYTHIGDEAQEQAISQLFGDSNSASDSEKIKKALAIIDTLKEKNDAITAIEDVLK
jgi:integrase